MSLNRWERALASIAPRYAAKRALARVQIERLASVERASPARRRFQDSGASFGVNTGNPDDARPRRFVDRATLLRLAYENPYGKKALNALVNNAVGWGITGAPKGPKALSSLWLEWVKVADYRGRLDFFGLQELAVRTMFREGESFIARKYVSGASVMPLRLQILDAGMLATDKLGETIEGGIEYDEAGNVAGYWFHQSRTTYRRNRPPVRYDAADVIHLFVQESAGQKRGISVFDPVIKKLGDIDDALDADLVRRKIESCFVGFRTFGIDDDGTSTLGSRESRGDELPAAEYFEPGTMTSLAPGEDVKFADPKPMGGLGEAVRINLLATAAGIGVTYEQLTGDLSNVNFSSYRAGALEFDAFIERTQWNTIIPVGLNQMWAWFCQAGYEFGKTAKATYDIRWAPTPRKTIDRLGDAQADVLEMQAGLENRRNLLSARGIDHDTFIAETSTDLKAQQGAGLFYKGDAFTAAQAAGASPGATA